MSKTPIQDNELTHEQVQQLALRLFGGVRVELDGCWEWTGKKNSQGYGYFAMFGRTLLAHRVSYFLSHGYWASPIARHLCHNPGCVNPAHLIEGTRRENWEDRRAMLAGLDLLKEEGRVRR